MENNERFKYISLYYYKLIMQKILHYPRLDTVLTVEKIIKNSKKPLTKAEIDRRLPKQIMRPTSNVVLDYLADSGKIAKIKEGIIWIFSKDISRNSKQSLI